MHRGNTSLFNILDAAHVERDSTVHVNSLDHKLVYQAADPYREHVATGEAWRLEHPEFEPKLCFYAFDTAVEHVEASFQTSLL